MEGESHAVSRWKEIFEALGNPVIVISKEAKPKYHTAASFLSNHVLAVLEAGYQLLSECGFSEKEARDFSSVLVRGNVEHAVKNGTVDALTGPIERADELTVAKHLSVLNDIQESIYKSCGKELLELAKRKNPGRDYRKIAEML